MIEDVDVGSDTFNIKLSCKKRLFNFVADHRTKLLLFSW